MPTRYEYITDRRVLTIPSPTNPEPVFAHDDGLRLVHAAKVDGMGSTHDLIWERAIDGGDPPPAPRVEIVLTGSTLNATPEQIADFMKRVADMIHGDESA